MPKPLPKGIKEMDFAPISYPTYACMGKTGFWRTFRPIIELSKCNHCLLCWVYCPEGSIKLRPGDTPEVDYEYCKGCGICSVECRLGAIKMEREKEEGEGLEQMIGAGP